MKNIRKKKRKNRFFSGCLFLITVLFLYSCQQGEVYKQTVSRYDNGDPKLVRYYESAKDTTDPIREVAYYKHNLIKYNGQLKEGKRNGKWVYYYDNGNKWSEGFFINDVSNSTRTVYHRNGQKYYSGKYNQGKRTGVWMFWDETGKLIKQENYGEESKEN